MNDFNDIKIRAWHAFNIGDGKVINLLNVKANMKDLVPLVVDASGQHNNLQWKKQSSPEGFTYNFNFISVYLYKSFR